MVGQACLGNRSFSNWPEPRSVSEPIGSGSPGTDTLIRQQRPSGGSDTLDPGPGGVGVESGSGSLNRFQCVVGVGVNTAEKAIASDQIWESKMTASIIDWVSRGRMHVRIAARHWGRRH